VAGPFSTGDAALGAVWALSGDQTRGVLYRVSEDGRQVLSRTPYDGSNPEHQQVTRVGSRVVVVNGAGTAYDVFDATGRQVGTVPAEQARGAAGDASGGWLITGAHAVTRVSAEGTPTGLVATLPSSHLIIGVATGGGALWVLDVDGTLYRVDAQTGAVTDSAQVVLGDPLQVVWTQGAVFISTTRYEVTRVDTTTLKATDVLNGNRAGSFQLLTVGTDGSLWTNPAKGAVAELDAATLTVKRYVQVFPGGVQGGAFGLAVTADRVFLSDGETRTLHSFAR
jgi:streptogramin lyase